MRKQKIRGILILLIILVLVIQFFRPERNISTSASSAAIVNQYPISEEIQGILKNSCYDCHSNNTVYPWYSNIQPFAWWQKSHVEEGKSELNFDEFGRYDLQKQRHKLDEVIEVIQNDEMPLSSYTIIHRSAVLSADKKNKLIAWAQQLRKTIR